MDGFGTGRRHCVAPWLAAAVLLSASPAFAQQAPSAAVSTSEQALLDRAVARGRLLFELDRAAWVGTDDMIANLRDYRSIGLRGYTLQLKVEKAGSIDEFRALRDPYLEAVLKAKGKEIARSVRTRLDQLLYMGEAAPDTTVIGLRAAMGE